MSALVDELRKQASILERHAVKTKCWPGDNDFVDAANPMRRAAVELTTLQSRLEAVKAERDDIAEIHGQLVEIAGAELKRLEAAEARVEELQKALRRYRNETPLGHQPHMIAAEVDALLSHPDLSKGGEE
jgi:hypothetical protein